MIIAELCEKAGMPPGVINVYVHPAYVHLPMTDDQ
jgi:acyl-CoA reductase-like NAD-dependent aldehyde dehydrogenase